MIRFKQFLIAAPRSAWVVIALTLLAGCDSRNNVSPIEGVDICEGLECRRLYFSDAKLMQDSYEDEEGIEIPYNYIVQEGENRVVMFEAYDPGEPKQFHSNIAHRVWFQVPMDKKDFLLRGEEELRKALTFYDQACYCPYYHTFGINGEIRGEWVDSSTLEISLHLTIMQPFGAPVTWQHAGIYEEAPLPKTGVLPFPGIDG